MNFVDNKEIEDTNHLDMPIFFFFFEDASNKIDHLIENGHACYN